MSSHLFAVAMRDTVGMCNHGVETTLSLGHGLGSPARKRDCLLRAELSWGAGLRTNAEPTAFESEASQYPFFLLTWPLVCVAPQEERRRGRTLVVGARLDRRGRMYVDGWSRYGEERMGSSDKWGRTWWGKGRLTASIQHHWAAPRTSVPRRSDVQLSLRRVQGGDGRSAILLICFFVVVFRHLFSMRCALFFHTPYCHGCGVH